MWGDELHRNRQVVRFAARECDGWKACVVVRCSISDDELDIAAALSTEQSLINSILIIDRVLIRICFSWNRRHREDVDLLKFIKELFSDGRPNILGLRIKPTIGTTLSIKAGD